MTECLAESLYLTNLPLNVYHPDVLQDLQDCYRLHQRLMQTFPETVPEDFRYLYRIEPQHSRILLQATMRPNLAALPEEYLTSTTILPTRTIVPQQIRPTTYRFRLNGNTRYRDVRSGKRIFIDEPKEQMQWLRRQGERHGFTIQKLYSLRPYNAVGQKRNHQITISGIQFNGILTVTDAAQFYDALAGGVGGGKAFGFGLVSIAKTR